jgi:excisionase family DNA binding protein
MPELEEIRRNPPVLMNEEEVAAFLGICRRSVRNFTSRGLIPVIRLGRRRLFRREAVMSALGTLESESPWKSSGDSTHSNSTPEESASGRRGIAQAKRQRLRAVFRTR